MADPIKPNIGPQIDYGQGPQSLTPEQTAALSGGMNIADVANMARPAAVNPAITTPTDLKTGSSFNYVTKAGDTISGIAATLGVDPKSITGYKSGDIDKIGIGETLTIPGIGTSSITGGATGVNTITPQNPLGITTQPELGVPSTASTAGTEQTKATEAYIAAASAKGPVEKQVDATTARINELLGESKGQASMLAEEERARGVEQLNTQLTAKNNEIKMLVAEREMLNADIQGKPITMDSIIGARAQVNAVIDSKIFYRTAEAQALMGNIQNAQYNAQRAVDAKYGPKMEELKILQSQLQLLQPALSKEEKIRATALERQYQEQQQAISDFKSEEKQRTSALLNWMDKYRDAGITLNDSLDQANAKIKNSKTYKLEIASLSSDVAYKNMQISKLQSDISSTGMGVDPSEIMAYAQQYASTGQIPTGLPKGTFGLVSQIGLEIPKSNGAIVNKITGVADSKTPATEQQDYSRLYNIVNNVARLKELDEKRVGGIVAGTFGKVFGSSAQSEYLATRKAIVDDMQRMQSGAALTPSETAFYEGYLPGRFSETFFLGQDSLAKIKNFETIIKNRLDERLASNNLSIQGYTSITIDGQKYKVGDIVTNAEGQTGRVNANGTITIVQ